MRNHADDRVCGRERRVYQVAGSIVELRGIEGTVCWICASGAVVHADAGDSHVVSARRDKAPEVYVVGVARVGARHVVAEFRGREIAVVGDVDAMLMGDRSRRVEVCEHVRPVRIRRDHLNAGSIRLIMAIMVAVHGEERNACGKMLVENRLDIPDFICVLVYRETSGAALNRCRREVAAVDDGVKSGVDGQGAEKPNRLLGLRQAAASFVPVCRDRIRRRVVAGNALALVDVGDHRERDVLALTRRGVNRVHLIDLAHDIRLEVAFKRSDIIAKRQKPS